MNQLSLQIPGQNNQSQQLAAPSAIPQQLKGGLQESGGALIQTGMNWLFLISAFLAIVFMIYSGIGIVTSGGDPIKLAAAKRRLFYAVIGLVVVALAFFIVGVVLQITGSSQDLLKNPTKFINQPK